MVLFPSWFYFFHLHCHLVFPGKNCLFFLCRGELDPDWFKDSCICFSVDSDLRWWWWWFLNPSADLPTICNHVFSFMRVFLTYSFSCPCSSPLQSREHSAWQRRPEKRGKTRSVSFHELRQNPFNCAGSLSDVAPFLGISVDRWLQNGSDEPACVYVCIYVCVSVYLQR